MTEAIEIGRFCCCWQTAGSSASVGMTEAWVGAGRVARTSRLVGITGKVGALPFGFAQGRLLRSLQGREFEMPAQLGRSCHTIPKRDFRPAFIDAHRPGFVQEIKTITAPSPFLGDSDQSPLHWIAMHIPELLHALRATPLPGDNRRRSKSKRFCCCGQTAGSSASPSLSLRLRSE